MGNPNHIESSYRTDTPQGDRRAASGARLAAHVPGQAGRHHLLEDPTRAPIGLPSRLAIGSAVPTCTLSPSPRIDCQTRFLLYFMLLRQALRSTRGDAVHEGSHCPRSIERRTSPTVRYSFPTRAEQRAIARLPRPRDGEDRCAGSEEGAADRAASGETHRPQHPRRHPGPRPERPHQGLWRRVAGPDPGALGPPTSEACFSRDHRWSRSQSFYVRTDRRRSILVRKRHTRGSHQRRLCETHERRRQQGSPQVLSPSWRPRVRTCGRPRRHGCDSARACRGELRVCLDRAARELLRIAMALLRNEQQASSLSS